MDAQILSVFPLVEASFRSHIETTKERELNNKNFKRVTPSWKGEWVKRVEEKEDWDGLCGTESCPGAGMGHLRGRCEWRRVECVPRWLHAEGKNHIRFLLHTPLLVLNNPNSRAPMKCVFKNVWQMQKREKLSFFFFKLSLLTWSSPSFPEFPFRMNLLSRYGNHQI